LTTITTRADQRLRSRKRKSYKNG